MRDRTRFWLLTALFLAAIVVSAVFASSRIQRDLLEDGQQALAAAQVPYYGLEFDGRDAVLRGGVASAEQAQGIENIVAAVPGVRRVRNELVVEALAAAEPESTQGATAGPASAEPLTPTEEAPAEVSSPPSTVPPAPAAQPATADRTTSGTPASLRMQRLGTQLFVSGRLPDDGSVEDLVEAAVGRFGTANVTPAVRSASGVAHPQWLESAARIVDLLAQVDGNGRLLIEGQSALLAGQVRDAAARSRLEAAARAIAGLDWNFDLFSRSGPLGGSAPS